MSDTVRPDGDENPDTPFDGGNDTDGSTPFDSDNAELELDEDTSLPWLEGAEDEDEYEGYNTGQLLAYVLIGFVLLGLIVGGIWWATHRDALSEPVADGSVIEAPDGDYKSRPDDPGGKTHEGTGDSSFAVSEGQTRPAQLGEGSSADASGGDADAKPGFDSVGSGANTSSGDGEKSATDAAKTDGNESESAASDASASSGVGVQVGAYSTRASAEANWNRLTQRHSVLKGMKYRVVEGKVDIGTVYRLQALPGDMSAAKALCNTLAAAGTKCHLKK